MIDLAIHNKFGAVSLTDIAGRHQISTSYLEQIFTKLRVRNLVRGHKGPGGGYNLTCGTDEVTVADIVLAVEDESPNGNSNVASSQNAMEITSDLWNSLNAKIVDFMQSVTLRSLVLNYLAKGGMVEPKASPVRGALKKPVDLEIPRHSAKFGFLLSGKSQAD